MTTSLPLGVDRSAGTPLAAQITAQLRESVTSGVLRAGERLPSTRDLAAALGVSRTVVTSAYAQLFAEGWLEGRHGSGSYVADVAPGAPADPPPPAPSGLASFSTASAGPGDGGLIELAAGVPWAEGIDPAMWRRAWRHAGARPPSPFPDLYGLPSLRAELARYLRRSRGLAVTPDQVLITRGVSNGLSAVAAALIRPGDRVGIEEPGYQGGLEVLRRAGADIVPCRVDANGVVPGELPSDLRLLYTTPAHQYPLGGRLPVARRQALIAWARAAGAVIVEDDYDGEFRYDVAPLPALFSMDPSAVVYLGTTSKILTPVFGAGWVVASPALVASLAECRRQVSERVPEPVQYALLSMLASGDLERHIRKMRLEYARRRAALMALPGLRGDSAGLHVVLELPAGRPAAGFAAEAAARGVGVTPADRYFCGEPTLNAVVLGYGATPLAQVRRAAGALRPLLPP
ncbi:MAG: PLP-dependent aminotransferase family protein [Streptosporangiales bacterium]|nr:PLP-dependent aminotransferase family protein [Streptosporangiales bacterium]